VPASTFTNECCSSSTTTPTIPRGVAHRLICSTALCISQTSYSYNTTRAHCSQSMLLFCYCCIVVTNITLYSLCCCWWLTLLELTQLVLQRVHCSHHQKCCHHSLLGLLVLRRKLSELGLWLSGSAVKTVVSTWWSHHSCKCQLAVALLCSL
jgi:hypothetical protein